MSGRLVLSGYVRPVNEAARIASNTVLYLQIDVPLYVIYTGKILIHTGIQQIWNSRVMQVWKQRHGWEPDPPTLSHGNYRYMFYAFVPCFIPLESAYPYDSLHTVHTHFCEFTVPKKVYFIPRLSESPTNTKFVKENKIKTHTKLMPDTNVQSVRHFTFSRIIMWSGLFF